MLFKGRYMTNKSQEFIVIPAQGAEILRRDFQATTEQATSKYDLHKVSSKLPLTQEMKPILDNDLGKRVVTEIASTHENGHITQSKFITEQSVKILGMTEVSNKPSLDYKAALRARNQNLHIPDELNSIGSHKDKDFTYFQTPKPGMKKR